MIQVVQKGFRLGERVHPSGPRHRRGTTGVSAIITTATHPAARLDGVARGVTGTHVDGRGRAVGPRQRHPADGRRQRRRPDHGRRRRAAGRAVPSTTGAAAPRLPPRARRAGRGGARRRRRIDGPRRRRRATARAATCACSARAACTATSAGSASRTARGPARAYVSDLRRVAVLDVGEVAWPSRRGTRPRSSRRRRHAMRDLYETLGVDRRTPPPTTSRRRTASWPRSGIPTRTPGDDKAEEKFKEITAAYDTLSDIEKRKAYDQFGASGGMSAGGFDPSDFRDFAGQRGVDLSDLLSDLFGRVRGGGPAGAARPAPERGADLQTSVTLSFDDALTGVQLTIPVSKDVTCPDCHGTRRRAGHHADHLPGVQGPGRAIAQPGLLLAVRAVPRTVPAPARSSSARARPARAGAASAAPSATPSASPPASRTAPRSGCPAAAARASPAVRPATCSCSSTSRPRRCSSGVATTSWSRCR